MATAPVPPPASPPAPPVAFEVYSWFPCAGGLRRGWASCSDTIDKSARRAHEAGIRLSGFMLDNCFQKHPDPNDPDANSLVFDAFQRCATSPDKTLREIATVAVFHATLLRCARSMARYGHGNDNWAYHPPPSDMAGWGYNYLFECLAPYLSAPAEVNLGIPIDGSANREEDEIIHLAIQQYHKRRTMVEAIPGPSSPFSSARYPAFAVYLAAKADPNTRTTPCPLHVIWRGAPEEAPILGRNPDRSFIRGNPVPLAEAIENCKAWRARLYVNIDMLTPDDLRLLAAAQGTATPEQPSGESEAA